MADDALDGLSAAEAAAQLLLHGPNILHGAKSRGLLTIALAALREAKRRGDDPHGRTPQLQKAATPEERDVPIGGVGEAHEVEHDVGLRIDGAKRRNLRFWRAHVLGQFEDVDTVFGLRRRLRARTASESFYPRP